MEAFQALLDGIVAHPTACMLAVTLIALGFLYKAREADRVAKETQIQKLNDDHKATIEKVIPVSEKLADAAVAVEKSTSNLDRLMDRAERLLEKLQEK